LGLDRLDLWRPGRPVTIFLDAGPALNFLATTNQNILIQVAAAKGSNIHVPERVEREILRKAHSDGR
jgi:hypothetical protein